MGVENKLKQPFSLVQSALKLGGVLVGDPVKQEKLRLIPTKPLNPATQSLLEEHLMTFKLSLNNRVQ